MDWPSDQELVGSIRPGGFDLAVSLARSGAQTAKVFADECRHVFRDPNACTGAPCTCPTPGVMRDVLDVIEDQLRCERNGVVRSTLERAALVIRGLRAEAKESKDEIAWLIELRAAGAPTWWDGMSFGPAICAVRFARKQDAQRVISNQRLGGWATLCTVTEHVFMGKR